MTKIKTNIKHIRAVGTDIGNNSTKTSEGVCFPSRVTRGTDSQQNGLAIKVKWKDEFYILGESKEAGKFTDLSKVFTDEYKVCLLTSIALSFPEGVINVIPCVGLPYDNYNALKDDYKKEILKLKNEQITIYMNDDDKVGITKVINIEDCLVEAEGSIQDFISDEEIPAMVVDFGGGTLDITKYDFTRVYENGEYVKKLQVTGSTDRNFSFDEVLNQMKLDLSNKGFKVNTDQELIAKLDQDVITRFNAKSIDFKKIKDTHMKIYVLRVYTHLINNHLENHANLFFIGGCSEIVADYLEITGKIEKKLIKIMPNSQFFNAINFKQQVLKYVEELDESKYSIIE